METALLGHAAVEDCVVLSRQVAGRPAVGVAYVVPRAQGPLSFQDLRRAVSETVPPELAPEVYVELRALPLTSDGDVDEVTLLELEVIDDELVRRWEDELSRVEGIGDVTVLKEEVAETSAALHLADVLPGWGGSANQSAENGAAPAPAGSHPSLGRPMAFADGGPLHVPAGAPATLTEGLLRTAAQSGSRAIHLVQADGSDVTLTYAQLLDGARRIQTGLKRIGLKAGDRAILQLPDLDEYFPTFWACLLGGIVPVTVAVPASFDPRNAVARKLCNAWQLLGQPPVIAARRVVESVRSLESALGMHGVIVVPVNELRADLPAPSHHPSAPEDIAFYQLSSGSTGVSKCVQITHGGVVAHIHGSQQALGFSPADITLNWLPMDHVVPLLMYHVKDVYLGIEQVQVPGPVVLGSPLKWLDYVEQYGVTHTWSPNFGYKMLADALATTRERRWDLSRVKAFLNAGEQVTLPVLRDFLEKVAPFGAGPVTMQPAYGMAELCTAMTYDGDFDFTSGVHRLAKSSLHAAVRPAVGEEPAVTFVDCGRATPGVQIRIVDRSNHLIREGTIGRIQVSGRVVTPGYLNNPAANAEAIVGDGWFNTGDLGFLVDGRLAITGREKELIIVNGANYYCYEIEDVASEIPGVLPTYAAACGVEDSGSGTEALALFFVLDESAGDDLVAVVKTIRRTVASQIGLGPAYVVPVAREEFPKTTSGKIQRGQLKQSLLDGRFRSVLQELDVRLENANTVPDWFYRPIWRQRRHVGGVTLPRGPRLVFLDRHGLGARLVAAWEVQGVPCVTVEPGDGFRTLAPARYQIAPAQPEDVLKLLRHVHQQVGVIADVVHLWTYGDLLSDAPDATAVERALDQGVYTLLSLVRALSTLQSEQPTRLTVVSSHAFAVGDDDRVSPDRGPVAGLLKTIPAELSWLTCRHVDVGFGENETTALAIAAECERSTPDRAIAYRKGIRWVERVEKVDLAAQPTLPPPFVEGGTYLLSGGLGGVATEVARHLLARFHARVLLVGRTPIEAAGAAKAATLRDLANLPGDVEYVQVDVADEARLREVVSNATARWGRGLDGVIHLAGMFHERPLADESLESFAATLRPKVQGTLALHRLLRDRPGSLFVAFSSTYGHFGGFAAGAYASANAFLDAFALGQRHSSTIRCRSVAWALWDGIGISRGYRVEAAARARGFRLMPRTQAVNSLLVALHHDLPYVLVGLDPGGRAIRSQIEARGLPVHQLAAYYRMAPTTEPPPRLRWPTVHDRFGRRSECVYRRLEALPRTPAGDVDRRALAALGRGPVVDPAAPTNDLEQVVAAVWQDALKQDGLSIHDNFFDLGGTSFLAGQIAGRLRTALRRNVAVTEMFQFPTIAAQAAFLTTDSGFTAPALADSQSRGAARRELARRPRRAAPMKPRAD